jgi:hypothetical protein
MDELKAKKIWMWTQRNFDELRLYELIMTLI